MAFTLHDFEIRIKKFKSYHALVLAFWAGLNLIGGGVLLITSKDQFFYFNIMNASWGLVNIGVAAFIYFHHNSDLDKHLPLLKMMDYQRHVEKVILFNIGLDFSFIAVGFALLQTGMGIKAVYPELWTGFGISVMMQGVFLLILDVVFYRLHILNRVRIYPIWQKMMGKL